MFADNLTTNNIILDNQAIHQGTQSISIHSNFAGNQADNRSAVMSLRFPLAFEETNVFTSNCGGAIFLLQARMELRGTLVLEKNTAKEGAGINIENEGLVSSRNIVHTSSCSSSLYFIGISVSIIIGKSFDCLAVLLCGS